MLWIASKEAVYPVCQLVEALLKLGAALIKVVLHQVAVHAHFGYEALPVAGDAVHKAFIAAAKLIRAAALCLSGAPGAVKVVGHGLIHLVGYLLMLRVKPAAVVVDDVEIARIGAIHRLLP